jgi:alpha-N-arabinofuranosidase
MKRLLPTVAVILIACTLSAKEYHVSVEGDDQNDGSSEKPLKTIQAAAEKARPGDVITVHAGIYRERINPPRGGESDDKRIVYRAAPGEKIEIKGSEVVVNWEKVQNDTWKVILPNSFFGKFNPYNDLLRGDWYRPKGRDVHTGAVYLNGYWLTDGARLYDVLKPVETEAFWFGKVDDRNTTLWAQFKSVDPNEQLVEINVRQAVFYPDQPGRNYITVRGFAMRHAATPWAPPTAEQIGLIGTHWSKGWIIERNVISHSICSGITLGKYGDEWDNKAGYHGTITRALSNGWNKDTIGHHVVRGNHISHCEQAGIVGSLGCIFSTVTGNTIHDIYVRRVFSGSEMAGIKFHAPIDVEISRNHIYRTPRGIWLDWMAQGARVSRNLFHSNGPKAGADRPDSGGEQDLFVEVCHGPYLVDNNLFLSTENLGDWSQGGAYVHNLFAGGVAPKQEDSRKTPCHLPHSTAIKGKHDITGSDNRFYNNIFVGRGAPPDPAKESCSASWDGIDGLARYDSARWPLQTGGNVFYRGARPYAKNVNPVVSSLNPQLKFSGTDLSFNFDETVQNVKTALVTTELLGKPRVVPEAAYENPDGSPLKIDTDYFGKKRNPANPTPGPFEGIGTGAIRLRVK